MTEQHAGDLQDPSEPYRVETAVETEPQPIEKAAEAKAEQDSEEA